MSDQYEKGVLKVLRYVYNQMERCRNADFDALGITSSQASVMMFLFKNRKHGHHNHASILKSNKV